MIEIGDKVASKYSDRYGTVVETWFDLCNYDLKVEIIAQDGLSYTYYEYDLYLIEKKEDKQMAKLTGFSKVAVIRQGCIDYHFAIYDDGYSYEPGNKVMVSGDDKVKTINEIITPEEAAERFKKNITAEVICPVDTSAYDERVNKRKAAEDLKKKMDDAIKKMDEEYKYEMYAEKNADLKAMLDQYRELVG